ncbi:MAG: hypothetical protein FWD49_03285 [Firmicutes bacterium]|nr:hypothetical protein [Bacillota bacterium]
MPNYEFKTLKCYPNDYTEQRYVDFYQNCGWQIMDMDRKQVYTGQSSDGTKNYSTSTHIKMQRDTSMLNYAKIAELSAKAERYFDTSLTNAVNYDKAFASAKGLATMFVLFGFFILPVIGWFLSIPFFKKMKLRKQEVTETYNKNKSESDKAYEECKALVKISRQ